MRATLGTFCVLVRTAGLEPAPGIPEQILSLLRLPFRHVRSHHNVGRRTGSRQGGQPGLTQGGQPGLTQGAWVSGSSRTVGRGRGLGAAPLLTGFTLERSISTLISSNEVSADFPTLTRSVSSEIWT